MTRRVGLLQRLLRLPQLPQLRAPNKWQHSWPPQARRDRRPPPLRLHPPQPSPLQAATAVAAPGGLRPKHSRRRWHGRPVWLQRQRRIRARGCPCQSITAVAPLRPMALQPIRLQSLLRCDLDPHLQLPFWLPPRTDTGAPTRLHHHAPQPRPRRRLLPEEPDRAGHRTTGTAEAVQRRLRLQQLRRTQPTRLRLDVRQSAGTTPRRATSLLLPPVAAPARPRPTRTRAPQPPLLPVPPRARARGTAS